MNYKVTHTTTYNYSEPVRVCHNVLALTPRPSSQVECHSHRLVIRPTPGLSTRRRDAFGNQVHAFSLEEVHDRLTITATSRLTVHPPPVDESTVTPAWDRLVEDVQTGADPQWFDAMPFRFDSPRITRHDEFRQYAATSFVPGRPVLEAALDLTSRIHTDFEYDSAATDVSTPALDAFRNRHGVCQDFAHVQVSCLRSLGLAARYVSGYLRTLPPPGKPRLVGADESHAWVAVFCGGGVGWVDLDPTNDCLCGTDHVPIAWGRDYGDVPPIRGVFLGGGSHDLRVSVDVLPVDS